MLEKTTRQGRSLMRTPIELACLSDEAVVAAGEVAVLLDRSVETLRRWRRDGLGPDYLTSVARPDFAEYTMGDVRRWMKSRYVNAASAGSETFK